MPRSHPHSDDDIGYAIRVRGRLDPGRADWFDGCTLVAEADGTTLILADALDQAALHGLLRRVRDAGLPLVSVAPAQEPDEPGHQPGNPGRIPGGTVPTRQPVNPEPHRE